MNLPTSTSKTYDNTRVSAYKYCPRSSLLRHVLHWTREGTAMPLVFGAAWHGGMDYMWRAGKIAKGIELAHIAFDGFLEVWKQEGLDETPSIEIAERLGARTPGIAKEMFFNYAKQRERVLIEADVLAIEQPFAVPLPGMVDTWYIGKLDKVVRWNVNKVVLEHKTTSDYRVVGNFNPDWCDQWHSAPQVKGYEFGAGLYYPGLDGVWVDGALVHKKVHDAFKFITVRHQMPLLVEWLDDTRNWVLRFENDLHTLQTHGRLVDGCFPKNEDACYGKYGVCPFLDICRHVADPTQLDGPPPGYREEKWEPFSVLGLDKLVAKTRENTSEV